MNNNCAIAGSGYAGRWGIRKLAKTARRKMDSKFAESPPNRRIQRGPLATLPKVSEGRATLENFWRTTGQRFDQMQEMLQPVLDSASARRKCCINGKTSLKTCGSRGRVATDRNDD